MAKPFFEHSTPQEHFNAINDADYEVQFAMIERDFLAVESEYRVNIALADYKVMTEGGTYDDLQMLYTEASEQKAAASGGIFQRLLDLIKDIFGAFKKLIFGENQKELEDFAKTDEAKQINVEKGINSTAVNDSMNWLQKGFAKIKDFLSGKSNANDTSEEIVKCNKSLGETLPKILIAGGVGLLPGMIALYFEHAKGIATFGDNITDCVNAAKENGKSEIAGVIRGFLNGMKKFVFDGLVVIADAINNAAKGVGKVFKAVSDTKAIKELPNALMTAFSDIKNERADNKSKAYGDSIAELEERIKNATSDAERAKYQKRLDRVKKRKDDLDYGRARRTQDFQFKDKDDADKKIAELKKDIEKLKDEIEELHKQKPVDEKKVDEKEDELDKKERELDDAEAQADELDKKGSDSSSSDSSKDSGDQKKSETPGESSKSDDTSRRKEDTDTEYNTGVNGKIAKFDMLNKANELINQARELTGGEKKCKNVVEQMHSYADKMKTAKERADKNENAEYAAVLNTKLAKANGNTNVLKMFTTAMTVLGKEADALDKRAETGGKDLSNSKDISPTKGMFVDILGKNTNFVNGLADKEHPHTLDQFKDVQQAIADKLTAISNKTETVTQEEKKNLEANRKSIEKWINAAQDYQAKLNTAKQSPNGKSNDGKSYDEIVEDARNNGINLTGASKGSGVLADNSGLGQRYLKPLSQNEIAKIDLTEAERAVSIIDDLENGKGAEVVLKFWKGLSTEERSNALKNRDELRKLMGNAASMSTNVLTKLVQIPISVDTIETNKEAGLTKQLDAIRAKRDEIERIRTRKGDNEKITAFLQKADELIEAHEHILKDIKDAKGNGKTIAAVTRAKATANQDLSGRDLPAEKKKAASDIKNRWNNLTNLKFDLIQLPRVDGSNSKFVDKDGKPLPKGSLRAGRSGITIMDLGFSVGSNGSLPYKMDKSGKLLEVSGGFKTAVCGSLNDDQIKIAIDEGTLLPGNVVRSLYQLWDAINNVYDKRFAIKSVNATTHDVVIESSSAFGVTCSTGLVLMESCEMIDLSEYDSEPDDILDAMNNL